MCLDFCPIKIIIKYTSIVLAFKEEQYLLYSSKINFSSVTDYVGISNVFLKTIAQIYLFLNTFKCKQV